MSLFTGAKMHANLTESISMQQDLAKIDKTLTNIGVAIDSYINASQYMQKNLELELSVAMKMVESLFLVLYSILGGIFALFLWQGLLFAMGKMKERPQESYVFS